MRAFTTPAAPATATRHTTPGHAGRRVLAAVLGLLLAVTAQANTLVAQTFTANPTWNTGTGWYRGGSFTPTVTSANGSSNWLRLTSATTNSNGYVYYNTAFSVNQGFVIDFEFASFGGSGADGLIMFLFDGATTTFRAGAAGGSLSYANDCSVSGTTDAGMSNAFIGIAFDEFGNFANQNDRCKNGGVGAALPESVSIRGAGNWDGTGTLPTTVYPYLTSASSGTSIDCTACTTRPETGSNWRRARITMLQSGSSWTVSVDVQFGTGSAFTRLINAYTLPSPPSTTLKIGFAAATGGSTNYHDIRNVKITNPVDVTLSKTVSEADVMVNSNFTYSLGVTNTNISPVQSVVVTDTMPTTQVQYVSATSTLGTCAFATPTVTCTLGSMTAGSSATITITGKGLAQGTANNTATVDQADIDINPNNNTATASNSIWSPPALTVLKSATDGTSTVTTRNAGANIVYAITVSNSGGVSKSNQIDDAMSPFTALDLNYVSAGQPFQFIAGSSGLTMGTPVYSNNNGTTWTYIPVSGGGGAPAGYDGAVTNFRIPLTGTMNGGGANYILRYNTRIE